MASDEKHATRQGYHVTVYPMVVKRDKQYMRIKGHGHVTSGAFSPSTVNGRREIGSDGRVVYVTNAYELRGSTRIYTIKKKK